MMRLLYVAVVVSVVSMIMIGSFMYSPSALKTALNRPLAKNLRQVINKGDTLSEKVQKYKTELWQLFQVKKASASIQR
jgi:hypothetical protein